jgi:thiosulfate reductase cytochrome b subunit
MSDNSPETPLAAHSEDAAAGTPGAPGAAAGESAAGTGNGVAAGTAAGPAIPGAATAPSAAAAPGAATVSSDAAVARVAVAPGADAVAGRRPLVHRHHWLVRVTHWANAVLLVGMIASGLQIYNAFGHFGRRGGPFFPNPFDGKPFPRWATLGGWLAGGLNWHFALAWPFVLTGAAYLLYMVISGEWRSLLFRPRDVPRAIAMQLYYLRLRRQHPPQGKHNALQKGAYTFILLLGVISVLSGFAIYKPAQLSWLTTLFGGYELARYWHFWAVFLFLAFTLVHVTLVLVVDPASLRAMITGWYRGRFPSHD